MTTLIRLFVALLIIGALGGAAMLALAYLVQPMQREITIDIAPERIAP